MRGFVFLALLSAAGLRAAPRLEFVGVLTLGAHRPPQVCLADRATDDSRWLNVGGTFCGFTVRAYEPDTGSVLLTRDGVERRLFLPDAGVRPATSALSPESIAAIRANLRLILAAARLHFLEGKARYATFEDLVGPDKALAAVAAVAGEDYRVLSFMKGELADTELKVTTRGGEIVGYRPEP